MKILTVIGARPQFIKASALSQCIADTDGVDEVLVHTGQHFDANMSDIFFDQLGMPQPHYNLDIGGLGHAAMTGRQLEQIEPVLMSEKPDVLLVYGDTNSTLAGGLAAAKVHIPVAHVEAGLRSFNRRMPEEINRVLTDHLSHWLFAPTDLAVQNLAAEGISGPQVSNVGDVMFDVALRFGERAGKESTILNDSGVSSQSYVAATIHRSESTDSPDRLDAIFEALRDLAKDVPVLLPMHPRTRKMLDAAGKLQSVERDLVVLPPLGYLDMTELVRNARLIVTDSGGLQKEAFFHGVPCVTFRDETEWVELVNSGWNILPKNFSVDALSQCLASMMVERQRPVVQPYGDGSAAQKILERLMH